MQALPNFPVNVMRCPISIGSDIPVWRQNKGARLMCTHFLIMLTSVKSEVRHRQPCAPDSLLMKIELTCLMCGEA